MSSKSEKSKNKEKMKGKRGQMAFTAAGVLGLIVSAILLIQVLFPTTLSGAATVTATTRATNESIAGVQYGGTNVTANDVACQGDFTFGAQVLWYNASNGNSNTTLSSSNFTGYANGTLYWFNANNTPYAPARANVTYVCYNNNIDSNTVSIVNLLGIMIAILILLWYARPFLGF